MPQTGLCFWAHGFTVAAQLPSWSKPVWARGNAGILPRYPGRVGGGELLEAEVRGLLGDQGPGGEEERLCFRSRGLVRQCE